jgi:hypothetical protein
MLSSVSDSSAGCSISLPLHTMPAVALAQYDTVSEAGSPAFVSTNVMRSKCQVYWPSILRGHQNASSPRPKKGILGVKCCLPVLEHKWVCHAPYALNGAAEASCSDRHIGRMKAAAKGVQG